MNLKFRIAGLPLISSLLPILVISMLIFIQTDWISEKIINKLDKINRENINSITMDVYNMCRVIDRQQKPKLNNKIKEAIEALEKLGKIQLSTDKVAWKMLTPFSKEETTITLPKMMANEIWLGQAQDSSVAISLMEVMKVAGQSWTLFQRVNKAGDMLSVASSQKTSDNKWDIARYIPAIAQENHMSPLIENILKGIRHYAIERRENISFLTAYEGLRDDSGKIIGMFSVSIGQEALTSLRQMIMNRKVGKTGHVWVLGGKGYDRGHYVISQAGERDGENLWNTPDSAGHFSVQAIITKALIIEKGEIASESYLWQNLDQSKPKLKISVFTYFEPWDWVIGTGFYQEDLHQVHTQIDSILSHLFWEAVIAGGIMLLMTTIIAWFFAFKIANPLVKITKVAKEIARGELSVATESVRSLVKNKQTEEENSSTDETGYLLVAIKTMTENLNFLVGQVQRFGLQVTSSATELAATAKQQKATMLNQVESTNHVEKAVQEISQVAAELVQTMQQVAAISAETAEFAGHGQSDLSRMESAMRNMENASKSISGRLGAINEKTENITSVVTTITKVADQTNLLSLNAAIEAEKAGEYGRGFNVVAREIRRLADQTAIATLDIENMVKEMQSAVSAGVMEMDKFIAEVKRSAENVGNINIQMKRIIEQVQALSPRFKEVNIAMTNQSQNAQDINRAMANVSEGTRETAETLEESFRAIEQLNEAARGLQEEVSVFKVN